MLIYYISSCNPLGERRIYIKLFIDTLNAIIISSISVYLIITTSNYSTISLRGR
jgi:hypothetical protein